MPESPDNPPAGRAWGSPGVALVPAVLRAAWAGWALPVELCAALGIDDGRWDQLDADAWQTLPVASDAEGAVLAAVAATFSPRERRRLGAMPVLESRWPLSLDPAAVGFRPHTLEVLLRLGARRSWDRLSELSIGQVLRARGAGVLTLLDFGCTAAAAAAAFSGQPDQELSPEEEAELEALVAEAWAQEVAADDPRFADLLGSLWPTTVAGIVAAGPVRARGALARVAPALRARVAEIAASPLEEALRHYLAALAGPKMDHRRVAALVDRLGLAGRAPLTLQEASANLDLTSERLRQLENEARERRSVACARPYLPQLDAALALVGRQVPVAAREVGPVLTDAGAALGAFGAESLLCAADLLGREAPFVLANPGPDAVVLSRSRAPVADRLERLCSLTRAQVRRYGATTLAVLADEMGQDGIFLPQEELAFVLSNCQDDVVLGDQGWLWLLNEAHTVLVHSSLRMLAVASPLSVASLYDGLSRHYGWRGLRVLPPEAVVAQVFRSHPSFRVDEAGSVWPSQETPTEARPATLDWRIIDILRAAPDEILDRASLMATAREAGLNISSVNLYLTYSECIERIAPGVYAARGTKVGPEALAALQQRSAPSRRAEPPAPPSAGPATPAVPASRPTRGDADIPGAITQPASSGSPSITWTTGGPASTITVSGSVSATPAAAGSSPGGVHVTFEATIPIEPCDPDEIPGENDPPA